MAHMGTNTKPFDHLRSKVHQAQDDSGTAD